MTDVSKAEREALPPSLPEEGPPPVPHARWRYRIVRRAVLKRILWGIVALPVAVAGVQIWHRMMDAYESRPVREVYTLGPPRQSPTVESTEFLAALSGTTEVAMTPGHDIELLLDGATTLAGIEADIRDATRSIAIQTYFCEPGKVTERLKSALMLKAREGVHVSFLPDGFGCGSLEGGYIDSLRAAGVRVAIMRPVHWYSLHRGLHRSHVRSVIIDSRVAYTGGFGFADKWIPSPEGPAWQETTARFTGPAVGQLAGAFAIAWADATGEVLAGDGMFPHPLPPAPGATAGLMFSTRAFGTPVPERYLALSLAGASRTAYMANPYFIPNADLRRWLKDAARRGVDVRILTASSNIDVKFTRWAARSTYQELLEGGVRIYEYTPSMLHAKTMVIDGVFGSVGSLNLDNISLRINDEATLMAQDSTLGAALDARFLADIAKAEEITLEKFRRRPLYEKLTNWAAVLLRNYM